MMINIFVTKEIYRRSMMCGVGLDLGCGIEDRLSIQSNCAISLSIRDIADKAMVSDDSIIWLGYDRREWNARPRGGFESFLPIEAKQMVSKFDLMKDTPEKRLDLPEFSFAVDFPDSLVEQIGIDQVREILTNSETLQLVEI